MLTCESGEKGEALAWGSGVRTRPSLWSAPPSSPCSRYRTCGGIPRLAGLAVRLLLGGFLLGEFVVDVLLKDMRVGTVDAPAVDKDSRGAADVELFAVGQAGIHLT